MGEKMTTALAQYLLLSNFAACVSQKAITVLDDEHFRVTADDGDFYFAYTNGTLEEYGA